jgi:cytochrome c oxidase assembly protein subunit 15
VALQSATDAAPSAASGSQPWAGPWLKAVRLWLYAVAVLVFAMIVVGGATRLTDSGLSITEWKPILGAIPPLSDVDWHDAFTKYQQIPEYHLVNKGMSLEEFKFIYWWEWSHRFLGRFIGVAFALPLVFFWLSGRLKPGLAPKLLGVLLLGGAQGAVGWFMVKSGLVDRVDVSHYRLALHLGIAFLILALVLWLAFDLDERRDGRGAERVSLGQLRLAQITCGLILLQVLLGALVAGLKAGLAYNTWPLMDGALIPDGLGALSPWYMNFFENVTLVQFNHRLVAYAVTGLALWQAWSLRRQEGAASTSLAATWLAAAVLCQAALGIWTLLEAVPLSLGLAHQGGAAIVLGLAIRHLNGVVRASS